MPYRIKATDTTTGAEAWLPTDEVVDAIAKTQVAKAGTLQGTRKRINFIEGSNVTLTVADNSGSDRVDVTIAASGGGGGSVATDTIFDAKGDLPVGTGADTAARLAVGSNGQVLTADSAETTGVKWATPVPVTIVYEYTTPQTDTSLSIPSGAKFANITVVGGGGGGGSGRKGAAGTNRGGGGGGGGGGFSTLNYPLQDTGTTVFYITCGAGGSGGASRSTDSTSGANGTSGGNSEVKANSTSSNNIIVRAGGGNSAIGGSTVGGSGAAAAGYSNITPFTGGNGSTNGSAGNGGGANIGIAPGGAGGGAGIGTANTTGFYGSGGAGFGQLQNGGSSAGASAASISFNRACGGGGAGGSSSTSGNAVAGGNGVRGGGGGGGGAAVDSVGDSGAGGNGGDGYVLITFFF